uniref:C2H2-type domain-containing protein n=1 Tax=Photinus pyralis TaxID=7054 RepID=A0A1Y1L512_PHOPY
MARAPIKCDVCSQILPQTEVLGHVLLHMSQITELCKSLPHPAPESNEELQQCDSGVDDTEAEYDTMDQQPAGPLRTFKCPDCDHAPFSRRQEQVRHFARHYEFEKACDYCSLTFYLASKYIWHRCGHDGADYQKAYKRRWQALRTDVGRALDQASNEVPPGKRRQEMRTEQRKKRKTAHSSHRVISAATKSGSPPPREELRTAIERETFASEATLQLISATSLPQTEGSDQSGGHAGIDTSFPQSRQATEYSFWLTSSSDAPIIWDNWNWPDGESWVPGDQDQVTPSR